MKVERVQPLAIALEKLLSFFSPAKRWDIQRAEARKKDNEKDMRECLAHAQKYCLAFQEYTDSFSAFVSLDRLSHFMQNTANCSKLPSASDTEKKAFVTEADKCLLQLRNEAEKMLQSLPA